MRDADSEFLAGCQLALATALCCAPLPWSVWLGAEAAPAWVQGVGSVVAIAAAIVIDRRSGRRAEQAKKDADNAILAACSSLSSIVRIKVEAMLEGFTDGNFSDCRMGHPVRHRLEVMIERLREFPLVAIPHPRAVVLFCDVLQDAENIAYLFKEWDAVGRGIGPEDRPAHVAWAIENATPLVDHLIKQDAALARLTAR